MHPFAYERPEGINAAVALLRDDPEAVFLAGGMTLIPTMKQRLRAPSSVIDLAHIPGLRGVRIEDGALVVGAMTPHAEVAANPLVQAHLPALAELAAGIGDPQVRARGTLGGSIANNDPSADYPAALLALDAQIVTDRRTVAADDFFRGLFETALEPDELVTSVRFAPCARAAYAKFRNIASGYAVAGVFVAQAETVRVAVTGAGPGVFRWTEAEAALAADFSAGALDSLSMPVDDLNSDIHASAEYRAHLCKVMLGRAVRRIAA